MEDPVEQYLKFTKFMKASPEERYLGRVVVPEPESDYIRSYLEELEDKASGAMQLPSKITSGMAGASLLKRLLKRLTPVNPPGLHRWKIDSVGPDILLNDRRLARWSLEELASISTPAKCGIINADGPQTVVNMDVRTAKYILPGPETRIDVTPEMWTSINGEVQQMYPGRRVRVEIDKINIYGPGDFFRRHVDAPKPGVIGSVVMCTVNGSCRGGDLHFYGSRPMTLFGSQLADGKWEGVAFLSSVEHEVMPVSSGFRISVTFLIKHEGQEAAAGDVPLKLPTPIGLLLSERYSLNELECGGGLKGDDTRLLSLTGGQGRLVPVIVKHTEVVGDPGHMEEESSLEESVYRFTRDDYEKFGRKGVKIEPVRVRMPFVWTRKQEEPGRQILQSNYQSYEEYTGNESQPEMIDNLYYTTALLLEE
jgi:hypothetical protein